MSEETTPTMMGRGYEGGPPLPVIGGKRRDGVRVRRPHRLEGGPFFYNKEGREFKD